MNVRLRARREEEKKLSCTYANLFSAFLPFFSSLFSVSLLLLCHSPTSRPSSLHTKKMAVQAQYPASVLLLNRAEQERNGKVMDFTPSSLPEQSHVFFSPSGANVNPKKRGRDAVSQGIGMSMVVSPLPPLPPRQQQHMGIFTSQTQAMQPGVSPPLMMGLSQFPPQTPPVVSTGLCLALDEKNEPQLPDPLSAVLSERLTAHINQQKHEIEQLILAQAQHLRQALVETRQRHFHALISAAEESIDRRMREKEEEIERAARRSTELEERLAFLRNESMAWQAKALAEQAAAASLHAQLQQVTAAVPAAEDCCGESPAKDEGSAYVDPQRTEFPERACRSCLRCPATVVLIPCRHLCLCAACDSAGSGDGCPVCGLPRTGSVQVFLS